MRALLYTGRSRITPATSPVLANRARKCRAIPVNSVRAVIVIVVIVFAE